MNKSINTVIAIIAVALILLFVLRSCQSTKKVEIKQKSGDTKTEFSVEVTKTKEQQ